MEKKSLHLFQKAGWKYSSQESSKNSFYTFYTGCKHCFVVETCWNCPNCSRNHSSASPITGEERLPFVAQGRLVVRASVWSLIWCSYIQINKLKQTSGQYVYIVVATYRRYLHVRIYIWVCLKWCIPPIWAKYNSGLLELGVILIIDPVDSGGFPKFFRQNHMFIFPVFKTLLSSF